MDELIKAIAEYLKSLYPTTKIYTEKIEQNAPPEYFFINLITYGRNNLIGRRVEQTFSIDIIYDAQTNKRLRAMLDSLSEKLEYIPIGGGLVRPVNYSANTVDGILHNVLDFNIHVFRDTPLYDKMQHMLVQGGLKNG